LDDRVARLESDFRRLEEQLSEEVRRIEATDSAERERAKRQADVHGIRKQLEDAIIGGIHLEIFGFLCLCFGTAFTTVPGEIAWLLGAIGF
jgi:hypothetical protein